MKHLPNDYIIQNEMKKKYLILSLSSILLVCFCVAFILFLVPTSIAKADYSELWTTESQAKIETDVDVPKYATEGLFRGINDPVNLPKWRKNGLKVTIDGGDNTVEFNNIIDINGFTKEDNLIDILPLFSVRGMLDYTNIIITFIDADDSSRWVSANIWNIETKNRLSGSKIAIETSTGAKGGYRWGVAYSKTYTFTEFGFNSFIGNVTPPTKDSLGNYTTDAYSYMVLPYSLSYDTENKIFYIKSETGNYITVWDIDDTDTVGIGSEFPGFVNNRVKMSIKITGIATTPASYMILNVAGRTFNGGTINDSKGPSCLIDFSEDFPSAEVGVPYKLFNVAFYDFIDGNMEFATSVKAPNSVFFEDVVGQFTPTIDGNYVIKYSATNTSGKKCEKEINVLAFNTVPNTVINVTEGLGPFYVGNKITVPKATLSQGSGLPMLDIKVANAESGQTYEITNDEFLPLVSGIYRITYTAIDYLDRMVTKCVEYNIENSFKPTLLTELNCYSKFVDGVEVDLPKVNAVDYYSLMGQELSAVVKIIVQGTGDKSEYAEEIKDYRFKPTKEKFGENVIVKYKFFCGEYEIYAEEITFAVPVIEPKYIWDYFSIDETTTEMFWNTEIQYNEGDRFVGMKAKSGATNSKVEFINPLQASDLDFNFSIPNGQDNFSCIRVSLVDFYDASENISYEISKNTLSSSFITYNGQKRGFIGGLTSNSILSIKYNGKNLIDYSGNVIFDLSSFGGFLSGKVWVCIELIDVTGDAAVKIKRLGTQPLLASYRSGEIRNFSDSILPTIEVLDEIALEVSYNKVVLVPSARAFDVCSPCLDVYVTLISPSGKKILDNFLANKSYDFVADTYGVYSLVYTVKDSSNKTTNLSYTIELLDRQAPVILYFGEMIMSANVNKELIFQKVEAKDALDPNVRLFVMVVKPDGEIVNVIDTLKYTPTYIGKYILRYYAVDSEFNYAMIDIEINVE